MHSNVEEVKKKKGAASSFLYPTDVPPITNRLLLPFYHPTHILIFAEYAKLQALARVHRRHTIDFLGFFFFWTLHFSPWIKKKGGGNAYPATSFYSLAFFITVMMSFWLPFFSSSSSSLRNRKINHHFVCFLLIFCFPFHVFKACFSWFRILFVSFAFVLRLVITALFSLQPNWKNPPPPLRYI